MMRLSLPTLRPPPHPLLRHPHDAMLPCCQWGHAPPQANNILLQKMVKLKQTDTRTYFRPWTARSTFQWKLGTYYDPGSGINTIDHVNLTTSVSPRSIHYYAHARPGTAPPQAYQRAQEQQVQADNTKLLRAITNTRSKYDVEKLERRHVDESVLVQRISNYRGPGEARCAPAGLRCGVVGLWGVWRRGGGSIRVCPGVSAQGVGVMEWG